MDFHKKWWVWVFFVLVLLGLLIAFFSPKPCGGVYNNPDKPFVSYTECGCFGFTGAQLYNLFYDTEIPEAMTPICFGICSKSSCSGKIIFKNNTSELDFNNCSSIGGRFCNEEERCQEYLMYDFCTFGSCWTYNYGEKKECCLQECSKREDKKGNTVLVKLSILLLGVFIGVILYRKISRPNKN